MTYNSLMKSLLYLWKVLHWLHTLCHLFLHVCCIVDGIVHFIWMRGWVNNYPHSVYGIYCYEFKKEKHNFSTSSPCFPIHFIHLNKLFLPVRKFSLYTSPYISFSRLVPIIYTYCSFSEYHYAGFKCRTRHLIFNCFDSCSLGVLMCSYVHAHVYSTSIYNLLLFIIAEWSQFLVTIFIQAHLLYLYNFNVLY